MLVVTFFGKHYASLESQYFSFLVPKNIFTEPPNRFPSNLTNFPLTGITGNIAVASPFPTADDHHHLFHPRNSLKRREEWDLWLGGGGDIPLQ